MTLAVVVSNSQKLCLPIQGWAPQHSFMGEGGASKALPSLSVYKQLIVAEEGRNIFFSSVAHQQGLYVPVNNSLFLLL